MRNLLNLVVALLVLPSVAGAVLQAEDRTYTYDSLGNRVAATNLVRFTSASAFNIWPRRAVGGDRISIFGRNFPTGNPNVTIDFNGMAGTVVSVASRVLTAELPMGANPGPVTITLPDGSTLDAGTLAIENVMVDPLAADLLAGQSLQFDAHVVGATDVSVIWDVNGIPGGSVEFGTVSSRGLYRAPTNIIGAVYPVVVGAHNAELGLTGRAVVRAGCTTSTPVAIGQPTAGAIAMASDRFCYDFQTSSGDHLLLLYSGAASARMTLRNAEGFAVEQDGVGSELRVGPLEFPFADSYRLEIESADATAGPFVAAVSAIEDDKFNWLTTGNGLWTDPSHWLPAQVPGIGDDAVANLLGTGTIQHTSGTHTIGTLICNEGFALTGGTFAVARSASFGGTLSMSAFTTLDIAGTMEMDGTWTWRGGTVTGAGSTSVNGLMDASLNGSKVVTGGHVLEVAGSAVWRDAGQMQLREGAIVRTLAGGSFDVRNNAVFSGQSGGGTFDNQGSLSKTGETGTASFAALVPLTNAGTVDVQAGSLTFSGGGSSTGNFNAAAGATVDFTSNSANPYSFGAGTTLTGDGSVRVTAAGAADVDANTPAQNFYLGSFSFLGGRADLTIDGTFDWAGGTIRDAGRVLINGALDANSNVSKILMGGRLVEIAGDAIWRDGGQLRLQDGSILRTLPGGSFDVRNTATLNSVTTSGTFDNQGTLLKSAGVGTSTFGTLVPLTNSGAVDVQVGTLNLTGGGTSSGSFNVESGASINFSSNSANPYSFDAGTALTGAGTVRVVTAGAVDVDADTTAQNISLGAFSFIGGTAELTVNGTLDWNGGTRRDAGRTLINGVLDANGNQTKVLSGAHVVEVAGMALWRDAGQIQIRDSSIVRTLPAGTFDVQGNATFNQSATGGAFENQGTLRKSAGAATTTFGALVPLVNTGVVDAQIGTLTFTGGGSSLGGNFNADEGASVSFSSNSGTPYSFGNGTTITGAGTTRVISTGAVDIDGNSTAENMSLSAFSFLGGTADLALNGTMDWNGGTMRGAGRLLVNGTLDANGNQTKVLTGGHVIEVTGTAIWREAGTMRISENSVVRTLPVGTFDIQGGANLNHLGTGGTFENQGTLRKSAGATTTFSTLVPLINSGIVDAEAGALTFSGGGISTGNFNVAAGATVNISSNVANPYSFGAGTTVTGAGPVQVVAAGALDINGNTVAQNMSLGAFSFLGGTADLTIDGTFSWSSGTLRDAGRLLINGVLDANSNGTKDLTGGRVVEVAGTAVWRDAGLIRITENAVLRTLPGGTFDVHGNASFNGAAIGGTIDNQGTLRKSVGTATSTFHAQVPVTNSGTVEAQSGQLSFLGGLTQTAGSTQLIGGSLSASTFDVQGGQVVGSGTLTSTVTNAGSVLPGGLSATGTLAVTGTYAQTLGGALAIEIGGTTAGDFDALSVSGAVTLGGTLDVSLLGGFTPTVGDQFTVLAAGSITGTFATENLPGGASWSVTYNADSVVLEVQP